LVTDYFRNICSSVIKVKCTFITNSHLRSRRDSTCNCWHYNVSRLQTG